MKRFAESVLILHHTVPDKTASGGAESDAGVMDEVHAVAKALEELGIPHRTADAGDLTDVAALLQTCRERLVFNLIESLRPRPADAMLVPAVCDAFRKTCTGNDSVCQTISLDKWRTKAILKAAGIPVPDGIVVNPGARFSNAALPPPPYIVKPLWTDASEGISARSFVREQGQSLRKAVARVHEEFQHPALVEQYFGDREINVAILQRGTRVHVLPLAEIEFRGYGTRRPRIVDYAAKWHPKSFQYKNTVRVIPAELTPDVARRIREYALSAWHALGCRDYARVDLRLSRDGHVVVLEVNPNPDISPQSGFTAALTAAHIPYASFVQGLCLNALSRETPKPAPAGQPPPRRGSGVERATLRWTRASDRDSILQFIKETAFFHVGEVSVAAEVLDGAIENGPKGDYQSYTLTERGEPIGWICFGATPCTLGTFDIYWIVVAPRCQGRGYGRMLLNHAEKLIQRSRGRMVLVETSGRSLYDSTRHFYLAAGYHEVSRVPEFYAPNDDRVIYAKFLHPA